MGKIWRRIYQTKKYYVFRLPKVACPATGPGSNGWVRLDNTKWSLDSDTLTFRPSVVQDHGKGVRRHFYVTNGRVQFLGDDSHHPGYNGALAPIRRMWISGLYDMLPKSMQARQCEPGADF